MSEDVNSQSWFRKAANGVAVRWEERHQRKPWFLPIGRSAWNATFFTILALLAGLIGALFAAQLLRTFPFNRIDQGAVGTIVVVFWSAVGLSGVLFYFRQRSTDWLRKSSEERLDATATTLLETVRTLPPADFLERFKENYALCEDTVEHPTLDVHPPYVQDHLDRVEKAIRVVLQGIATLASHFGNLGNKAIYGANVMLFRTLDQLPQDRAKELENATLFKDADIGVSQWAAVLELDPKLSTSTDAGETGVPDSLFPKLFCLPIPKTKKVNGRSQILPGAPDAFFSQTPQHFESLELFFDALEDRNLTPEVIDLIKSYFKRSRIKSFVSISLPHHRKSPVGVFNLDCSNERLLKAAEGSRYFINLLPPFESLLLRLITLRETILAGISNRPAADPVLSKEADTGVVSPSSTVKTNGGSPIAEPSAPQQP